MSYEKFEQLKLENPEWLIKDFAKALDKSERSILRYSKRFKESINTDSSSKVIVETPKILVLDIETNLCVFYAWHTGQQYIGPDQIIKPSSVICWAAKWLYDSKVYSAKVSGTEAYNREDKSIIERLWSLIDKADIIVGHNLAVFDDKKISARFLLNNLPKPSPYQIIDTLKITRKNFGMGLESHKLDYLSQRLHNKQKLESGYHLWKEASEGSDKAIKKLDKYCRGDILLTEELLIALKPWLSGINFSSYVDTDKMICPNPLCGSENITYCGKYRTAINSYSAFRCNDCQTIGRVSQADNNSKNKLRIT